MEGHTSLSHLSRALGTYFLCSRPHHTGWCWFITKTPFLHPQTHRAQISLWACGSPQLSSTWQPRSWAHRPPAEPASQASAPAPPPGPQDQSAVTTVCSAPSTSGPPAARGRQSSRAHRGRATSARAGLSVPVTPSDRRAAVHRSGRQRSANRDHGGHTRTPLGSQAPPL